MGINVAVVGATGVVGEEMLATLHARSFPLDGLRALASHRSAGRTVSFGDQDVTVEALDGDVFTGVDLALFSIDSDLSRIWAPRAVAAGAVVVDNSNAFRMDDDVPLVVPEVNPAAVGGHRGIIANPNCSTILLVVVLDPIHRLAGLERVVAATYQAVSGAGRAAMEELLTQTRDLLAGKESAPSAFPHPIAFNLIPSIGRVGPDGYTTEERKMLHETRKILGLPDLAVSTTCVRLPVVRAHSEAVNIQTRRKVTVVEVRAALDAAPGVRVVDDPTAEVYPMPRDADGQDDVLVGRIREDKSLDRAIDLFLSGDQIRKGAALNAVQIGELLVEKGLLFGP